MAQTYTHQRRVEFHETDLAGIVHFSRFFTWMEAAEHAFFRSLGLSVVMRHGDEEIGWPRVHAECDFSAPVRFEDEVTLTLSIRELRAKAVVYDFAIARVGPGGDPQPIATGSTTTVCTNRQADGSLKGCPIPDSIVELLRPFVA